MFTSKTGLPMRLHRTLTGKLVLQVQETRHHLDDLFGSGYMETYTTHRWRNARLEDVPNNFLDLA